MIATHRRTSAATQLAAMTALATVLSGVSDVARAQDDAATTSSPPSGSLVLEPTIVQFGEVAVGERRTAIVTVTAEGGPIEDIHAFVDEPFAVDNGCTGLELAAGEHCTLEVEFVPTTGGTAFGALEVEALADGESVELGASVALNGAGVDPAIPTTGPPVATTSAPPDTTSSPPPTSSPSSTTPPIETREQCDARALQAEIAYTPRLQMRVGESVAVEVSASTSSFEPPATTAPGPPTTVVPQPLRCQVRARIIGNEFTIQPEDWQVASFLGTEDVSWLWLVTPRAVGDGLLLILQVQGLRFDAEADEYVPAGEAFQETAEIRVDSEPKGLLSRFNDVVTGIVTHPVFTVLAGTGALAVLAGWAIRHLRQTRAEAPRPEPHVVLEGDPPATPPADGPTTSG